MRVLLTGHNGYIGAVMAPFLIRAGHEVVGLDSFFFEECTLEPDELPVPAIRKDVRDVTECDLEGFDAVVHLAALCNDPLGDLNPQWTHMINYEASVRLANLSKRVGIKRFLYSSSCSMYGVAGEGMVAEESPFRPLTAYAVSKVRTEEAVSALANDGFSPVFLRNATVYGVSPRLRADVVLNNLVAWAYTTGKVRILSDGTPWRPIVHVEDVCRAFAACLEAPREVIHNQAFNVGANSENYQVRDLANIVQQVVPKCTIEYDEGAGPDPRSYRVDFGKLTRSFPGWITRWDATRGAAELYEAYRRVGLTLEDFTGRRYTRLKQLGALLENRKLDEYLRWRDNL